MILVFMTICDMRVPIDYIPHSNILGYYGKHPPFVLTITKICIGLLDMQIDIFDKSNMELIRLIKCPDIWGRVILVEQNLVALKHKTHIHFYISILIQPVYNEQITNYCARGEKCVNIYIVNTTQT